MTFKECCRILGLAPQARLDDVKRAYRRRAFELHPDLNPHLVDAGRQFQLLNEAYVHLVRLLEAEESKKSAAQAKQAAQSSAAANAANAADSAATPSGTPEPEKSAEGTTTNAADATAEGPAPEAATEESENSEARQRRMADAAYAQQEDVLRDILNDQFARRVFEDIYQEASKKHSPKTKSVAETPLAPPKKRKLNLEWGDKILNLDFSSGVTGMMRNWLRSQIDDELTFQLPAAKLFPGARVRLQIRQGLTNELRVLEVTLPPDFKSGKPFRLKGMGKKVGRWQGDLYLCIEAKA